jgi:hypothetical protein
MTADTAEHPAAPAASARARRLRPAIAAAVRAPGVRAAGLGVVEEAMDAGALPAAAGVHARGATAPALRSVWSRLLRDEERAFAARDSARALLGSRALVWLAGSGTLALLGFGPVRKAFDPPGLTRGFGWLGDLLAGPAARWDSSWYLIIAQRGYRPDLSGVAGARSAFFPLYPLGLRAISWLGAPPVAAGVALSLAALAVALYCVHRLCALEFARAAVVRAGAAGSRDIARLAVALTAFAPMAFFLSAVYSESLYLALSTGMFLAARRGRWALVGALGAFAAATRSAGVLLLLPALILYLYGPREDRAPDFAAAVGGEGESASAAGRRGRAGRSARAAGVLQRAAALLVPRYRARADLLWLALVPAGLGAYMGYLALAGGDALLPFSAQQLWGRHFVAPFAGGWDGVKAAFEGARQLLSFQQRHVYFPVGGQRPSVVASHNLLLAAFMLAAVPALAGVLRKLPFAYGAYVIAALAVPLSDPIAAQPLMSLPRFLLVLFPLQMWLAGWLAPRTRLRRGALVASALLLVFFTAQFATWHWVA